MTASHRVYSSLFDFSNFVTQTSVYQGKNLIIDALREYFRKDDFYKYVTDAFGFPLTPDLTDLPPDIQETRTTRIYIGDIFRYDKRFFPSIVVKYGSGRTYHISFNQNQTYKYRVDLILDGYGGQDYIRIPSHKVFAGAWEQSFEIIITTESIQDREELTDIVSSFFIAKVRQEIYEGGLFIKGVSIGSENESEFGNKKIFSQSVTIDTFSEWRIEIPIDSLIERINFCFNYNILGFEHIITDSTLIP
jgi:hypothetical protein